MNYTKEQLYEYGLRDIPNYEGLYAVTSCGKIWSYKRKIFLKPARNGDGYLQVILYKDGKPKNFRVNRLVAITYIPNPDNLPEVLHIDEAESRDHNWVNNLKWGTHKDNCNNLLFKQRDAKSNSKRVRCIETEIIYNSIKEAAIAVGITSAGISLCCNGKRKTAGGYHWEFVG